MKTCHFIQTILKLMSLHTNTLANIGLHGGYYKGVTRNFLQKKSPNRYIHCKQYNFSLSVRHFFTSFVLVSSLLSFVPLSSLSTFGFTHLFFHFLFFIFIFSYVSLWTNKSTQSFNQNVKINSCYIIKYLDLKSSLLHSVVLVAVIWFILRL